MNFIFKVGVTAGKGVWRGSIEGLGGVRMGQEGSGGVRRGQEVLIYLLYNELYDK